MATRKVIQIDEDKCVGCGLCVNACQEGVIELVDGIARVMREDHCDGLGNCLPVCPTDAISFVEKEVKASVGAEKSECGGGCPGKDAKEIKQGKLEACHNRGEKESNHSSGGGCPGKAVKELLPDLPCGCPGTNSKTLNVEQVQSDANEPVSGKSELRQWPVQMKLVPVNAPYFNNANLLIAADCAAYAAGDFHSKFMKKKITIIGCPKLDSGDYADKLTEILKINNIKSVTLVKMEVPCCGGLEAALKKALLNCGKLIPWQIITLSLTGQVLDE